MKGALFFIPFLLFGESFITQMEYASLLYKNPRGIGCHKCHGLKGEGKIISPYIDKGKKKFFKAPAINKLTYEKFYNKLNQSLIGMPKYYLIEDEIKALYFYLKQVNIKDSNEPK